MIEDLKDVLTGSPIDASNTDDAALSELENEDKAITAVDKASNETAIDIKEEQKTESYKETMNIDIENINTIKKRNNLYTKLWRTIYEVIQQYIF